MKLPIVGVMGAGRAVALERAEELGAMLAGMGVHLLTGGGPGAMEAVSRGFARVADRQGSVIGVLPAGRGEDYPNPWVEISIRTHLSLSGERGEEPMSRNHINVLTADAIVALPGGPGTLSEVRLALRYGKPLVAYLQAPGELPGLPDGVRVEPLLGQVRQFLEDALGLPHAC
jgi:uncharacterized protein (TIGR00725 family)